MLDFSFDLSQPLASFIYTAATFLHASRSRNLFPPIEHLECIHLSLLL